MALVAGDLRIQGMIPGLALAGRNIGVASAADRVRSALAAARRPRRPPDFSAVVHPVTGEQLAGRERPVIGLGFPEEKFRS